MEGEKKKERERNEIYFFHFRDGGKIISRIRTGRKWGENGLRGEKQSREKDPVANKKIIYININMNI